MNYMYDILQRTDAYEVGVILYCIFNQLLYKNLLF